jgi:DsbC/DsbD-like thiol-disulfide interchange protein
MKLLITLMVCATLAPQAGLAIKTTTETRHVKVSTSTSAADVTPGGKLSLFADIEPKPKMHVYAPGQRDYLAVSLTLDKDAAITAAAPKFPAPEKLFFKPLNETQLVYSHPFRITQPVTIARSRAQGNVVIKGTLRYQACDDAVCYIPATVPLAWTVRLK